MKGRFRGSSQDGQGAAARLGVRISPTDLAPSIQIGVKTAPPGTDSYLLVPTPT